MYSIDKLRTIHLELTDKCNASCPQCARNKFGGVVNPYLPLKELSLEDIKTMFPSSLVQQLHYIFSCGNYGDPIVARDLLPIYRYFRSENKSLKLALNTNGSHRDPDWWRELGGVIGERGDVKFGIDGLADTHHLYRQGTDFHKILENAQAFIEGGGKAIWEFIIFKHNEHQIEEARALAEKMGFALFRSKKTGRFFSNTRLEGKQVQEVHNKKGEITHYLEKPTQKKHHNSSLLLENELKAEFGSMENYIDQAQVLCKTKKEGSIYISSEGAVFPCCWTGNQLYLWYMPERKGDIWEMIDSTGGLEHINAKYNSIESIMSGPFFKAIADSWEKKSIKDGKLKVCAKTCSQSFDQYRDQYK